MTDERGAHAALIAVANQKIGVEPVAGVEGKDHAAPPLLEFKPSMR